MTATSPRPIKVLLQTTIRYAEDDWHVNRFRLLRDHIASLTNADGSPLAVVTARDREPDAQDRDPVYNWDVHAGCPSFVSENPSDAIAKNPALLTDTKQYVRNLVEWLERRPQ